jgi:hypothetical protein
MHLLRALPVRMPKRITNCRGYAVLLSNLVGATFLGAA